MAAQARAACTTRAAPATTTPHALQTVAEFTPFDGLNQLVRAPQLSGSIHAAWVASAFAWL